MNIKETTLHTRQKDTTSSKKSSSEYRNISSKEILSAALNSLENSKAEDIFHIDITGKSALFDHIIVTSGRSHRHVKAIADYLLRALKTLGVGKCAVEGMPACDWVLIDAKDVIIHIFRPEVREFYNIEKMWHPKLYHEATH